MLYHLTKPENLPTILTAGLIPDYKRGIGRVKYGYVFLTNDVERIIETQLGRNYWREATILHIETDNVKPFLYTSTGISIPSDYEFITDYVSPNDIIKTEYLKF